LEITTTRAVSLDSSKIITSSKKPVKTLDEEARRFFPFRRIKHDPLFEPKKRSSILQLADFGAYVAKRIAMDLRTVVTRRFYDPMHAQYWQGISATPRPSKVRGEKAR
jgi:hypothetical protein